MINRTFSVIAMAAILTSCGPQKQSNDETQAASEKIGFTKRSENVQTLIQSDNGILRGIDLGVPASVIKKKESAKLETEDSDFVYFQSDLNDVEFFDIEYSLVEDTIYGIEMEVFAASNETAPIIYVELEEYFDQKFGKSIYGLNDYQIWNTKTANGLNAVIGMKFVVSLEENSSPRVQIKSELANW